MDEQQTNVFIALAEALWAHGEDGEEIARDLAQAFQYVATKGVGEDKVQSEFIRFTA